MMRALVSILFVLNVVLGSHFLYADDIDPNDQDPWFTGTLLAFFPQNTEPKKVTFQGTFFGSYRYGIYGRNSHIDEMLHSQIYTGLFSLETGITKNIDIAVDFIGVYSHTPGGDAFNIGDAAVFLGFQIASDKKGTWIPDIRVLVGESFPTGKYQKLNPALEFADATGLGTYNTSVFLILRKIFYTCPRHPYNWNLTLGHIHSSGTHVKGLSSFGGDPTTISDVDPSERFWCNLAYEYKFNQRWGWGCDLNFFYQDSASFVRNADTIFEGSASSYLLSLAPMIEYNINQTTGINGGVWFTVRGRNEFAFASGVVSIFFEF